MKQQDCKTWRARIIATLRAGEEFPLTRHEDEVNCLWLRFVGKRAELVAGNICNADEFPSGRKRLLECDSNEFTYSRTTWRITGDFYAHEFWWNDHTRALIRHPRTEAAPRDQERPAVYSDSESWAEECESVLEVVANTLVAKMCGETERDYFGSCTIRYAKDDVARVRAALDHATQLLQAATPLRVVSKLQRNAEAAKADNAFQRFLLTAQAAPSNEAKRGAR